MRMRCVAHETYMVNLRNALNVLVKNPEGKKPLGTLKL
jgi:hypothetical protein